MSALRESARGQDCTMQVATVCNHNPDTSVLAHFRWLGDCGTGFKPTDLQAAIACSECNRWTDSPTPRERTDDYESERNWYAMRAMVRTYKFWISIGLITVKGMPA